MDYSSLARLQEEQEKGLSVCVQKISQWEKFKHDYEKLKSRLETLADRVSYEIMVPFGPQAFMPGKMIHTNEIMVLLGDNWFVERSSKQAAEIVDRRMKQCEKMLEDLDKEKMQFESWMKYTSELQASGDMVEIMEEYDAEKEEKWKEQHKKNVKVHKMKLAEEKVVVPGISKYEQSDEDLWAKLDRLQLEEAEKHELSHLDNEITCIPSDDKASLSSDEMQEDDSEESDEDKQENDEEKRVRWQDEQNKKTFRITFTHSGPPGNFEAKSDNEQESRNENWKDTGNIPNIQSPSDIYKCFETSISPEEPISILKSRKASVESVKRKPLFDDKESIPIVNVKETYPLPKYQKSKRKEKLIDVKPTESAFTGEILEKNVGSTASSSPLPPAAVPSGSVASKPVSRFKSARQTSKK